MSGEVLGEEEPQRNRTCTQGRGEVGSRRKRTCVRTFKDGVFEKKKKKKRPRGGGVQNPTRPGQKKTFLVLGVCWGLVPKKLGKGKVYYWGP